MNAFFMILAVALAQPLASSKSKFPVFHVADNGNHTELSADTSSSLLGLLNFYILQNRETLGVISVHSIYRSCPPVYIVYLNWEEHAITVKTCLNIASIVIVPKDYLNPSVLTDGGRLEINGARLNITVNNPQSEHPEITLDADSLLMDGISFYHTGRKFTLKEVPGASRRILRNAIAKSATIFVGLIKLEI